MWTTEANPGGPSAQYSPRESWWNGIITVCFYLLIGITGFICLYLLAVLFVTILSIIGVLPAEAREDSMEVERQKLLRAICKALNCTLEE